MNPNPSGFLGSSPPFIAHTWQSYTTSPVHRLRTRPPSRPQPAVTRRAAAAGGGAGEAKARERRGLNGLGGLVADVVVLLYVRRDVEQEQPSRSPQWDPVLREAC